MRPEAHAAALRSAAKLVLGMASIATFNVGCSSETSEETAANDSAVTTTDAEKTCEGKPTTTPTPAPACGAVLNAAFPKKDGFTWQPHAQSAEVVACCRAELAEHDFASPHRWDCCWAFDPAEQKDPNTEWPTTVAQTAGLGLACTPWGPPVPPSMNRKIRRSPARRDMAAFIAQAVA